MKELKAFVRPERLTDIVYKLREVDISCLTVFEGEGCGDNLDPRDSIASLKHPFMHNRIAKIEVVLEDEEVEQAFRIIHENGKTGYPGDGLVYVSDVERAVKVKTLEPDE